MITPGFQKTGTNFVASFFAGDIIGGQTTATLATEGFFAMSDCRIGNALFRESGNSARVSCSATEAGTQVIAGINARNTGGGYMSWADSAIGYGYVSPVGSQPTAWVGGKIGALLTGVGAEGTANHVPLVGELVWAKLSDGSLASAPASVTAVAGYVKVEGVRVFATGYNNESVTIGANQALVMLAGQILGA